MEIRILQALDGAIYLAERGFRRPVVFHVVIDCQDIVAFFQVPDLIRSERPRPIAGFVHPPSIAHDLVSVQVNLVADLPPLNGTTSRERIW